MYKLPRDVIRHIALKSGLELKLLPNGTKDLRKYMFTFADSIVARVMENPDGLTYYPATFKYEETSPWFVVTFRDIPEAITQGKGFDEAVEYATDALNECKDFYKGKSFPKPSSPKNGDVLIGIKL